MTRRVFRYEEGSIHDRFHRSRAKIQFFGGGFANGKTANNCIKAIRLAKDYPGSFGLIARATKKKLRTTIMKEMTKWCPPNWIKSWPKSENSDMTLTLTNGSQIVFSHIRQEGKQNNDGSTTSNVLSATFDWIIVDQIEDPEFEYKDFDDLLGRLRGSTPYAWKLGDPDYDATMPATGPRWLMITSNPTRNWVYRKLIKPYHDFLAGRLNPDLLCVRDKDDRPILGEDGKPQPVIELFEGSTYENKNNLPADFISTLEATYRGQMRDRFLLGKWAAYEGLVYWMFNDEVHGVGYDDMWEYYKELKNIGYHINILEAYDHGLSSPSCYGFSYVDPFGNVCLLDGFYEPELPYDQAAKKIKQIRRKYLGTDQISERIYADPALFRRGASGERGVVGIRVSDMFMREGVNMQRGNNDIMNGIIKVQGYMLAQKSHENPFTNELGAPYLYINNNLNWFFDEVQDYMWRKNTAGDKEDVPIDRNDHAMDMTKYLLSRRPLISSIIPQSLRELPAYITQWTERRDDTIEDRRKHRYG